ncbi:MAG: hypothetical protein J6V72_02610 [Kiritimatiellae bacterium]|nr:hypothetical protein [Kiritimatiellia bacterium]
MRKKPQKPRTCERCPKYSRRNSTCAIYAQYMTPNHPVCEYGRRLMANAYMADWQRKKRGSKKRPAPPEPTPADWDRLNNTPCRRRTRKLKGVKVLAS